MLPPSFPVDVLTPLGRALGHAARRGLIPANPMRKLERGERPSVGRREMRILDRVQIGKVLDATTPGYRALLGTAIFTGLRQGELLGLTWADIDFDAGLVGVRRALDRSGQLVEPKTPQAVRDVVLMPALGRALREHMLCSAVQRRGRLRVRVGDRHGALLAQRLAAWARHSTARS